MNKNGKANSSILADNCEIYSPSGSSKLFFIFIYESPISLQLFRGLLKGGYFFLK